MMLSKRAILDRIADVIRDYNTATGKSIRSTDLSADHHFCDDLGGESMDLIAIALALEDAFGISIDEEELVDADPWQLGNLASYVERRLREIPVG